ncbi:hypothetical protein [Nostoc sp. NMS4]|uniref:hypothetical protein n=1 Tax=Nostoc sp. NMS4 TaxID=2815390 RepID=UPI0025CCA7E4|nr:hypothetical protein [Nostoc sp. NMS4]MBN3927909.1 hypothetical protein [Nostoc sp. NMS4]
MSLPAIANFIHIHTAGRSHIFQQCPNRLFSWLVLDTSEVVTLNAKAVINKIVLISEREAKFSQKVTLNSS